ncbi:MAG TPA: hypothetical protein VFB45_21315 [Pseudolabrys sp.]|nr:hypothetical protein [Pseudolabrys sp.]
MLRKLAIALVATTLVAGPVFAQNTTTLTPSNAPAASTSQPATTAAKPATTKKVWHARKHSKKMHKQSKLHGVKHVKHAKVSKRLPARAS